MACALLAVGATAAAEISLPEQDNGGKPLRLASSEDVGAVEPAPDRKREAAAAVVAAGKAIAEAKRLDALWTDSQATLTAAKKAGQNGDFAATIRLAERVRREAEMAINQTYLARARFGIAKLENRELDAERRDQLEQARRAYREHRGEQAWRLVEALE